MIEGDETPEFIRFMTGRWIFVLDKRTGTWVRLPNEPMLDAPAVKEEKPKPVEIPEPVIKEEGKWSRG